MRVGVVLGGGGAKGSFQVGALKAIIEEGHEITHVTGASVGALNGALVAIGKFKILEDLWNSIDERNSFYPSYPLGIAQGVLLKDSLFSNEWLVKNINNNITPEELYSDYTAHFGCTLTNLIDGKIRFANTSNPYWRSNILKGILASASLPPAFPPVEIDGLNCVDGGLTSPIPVKEILTFPNQPEKIFIIPAGSPNLELSNPDSMVELASRSIDILFESVYSRVLSNGTKKWTEDSKFVLIQPEKNLVSTLDCNPTRLKQFMQLGYDITKEVLDKSAT
ncbi:MAG: patatin-like phospholipase family protein [Leptospiraceae bacterium]|nr:patatin-like phospholipase family protein [Leptospiraceae bacterium]